MPVTYRTRDLARATTPGEFEVRRIVLGDDPLEPRLVAYAFQTSRFAIASRCGAAAAATA